MDPLFKQVYIGIKPPHVPKHIHREKRIIDF